MVQHGDQLADLVHVQAGGRLVQDVHGARQGSLAQFARDLDALRLAAGKRGGCLPQADVAQPHVFQHAQPALQRGVAGKELPGLVNGEVEHFGYVQVLVAHFQRFLVEASAMADIAGDEDVRQKVHFHADLPVSLAGLAASAGHVEAEAAGCVAAFFRVGRHGVDLAYLVEDLRVCRRIGARGAAYGLLIDGDHALDLLQPFGALHGAGLLGAQPAVPGHAAVKGVDDQRTLAGA